MNKIDQSIENIKQTCCLTDDVELVINYISWLEVIFKWGYQEDYKHAKPEELRKEYCYNHEG